MSAERTIRICLISGEKNLDALIHHFDLFEPCKMLATPMLFRATVAANADLKMVINAFREFAEKERCVAAAFIPGTDLGYVNPGVIAVSNGETFCALEDLLDRLDWRGGRLSKIVNAATSERGPSR